MGQNKPTSQPVGLTHKPFDGSPLALLVLFSTIFFSPLFPTTVVVLLYVALPVLVIPVLLDTHKE